MSNIQDLLTKTLDEITAITDGTTSANKSYMQTQIFGALQAIGVTNYHENYLILSSSTEWPSFNNLQELLTSSTVTAPLAANLDLVINIKEEVNNKITIPRPYCYLYSNIRNFFTVGLETTEKVSSMFFSNLIIDLNSNIGFDSCVFDNCRFIGPYSINILTNCEFKNCLIENDGAFTTDDGNGCKIISSEVYSSGTITLNGLQELTFSKLNKEPIDNITPITLNDFNIILNQQPN